MESALQELAKLSTTRDLVELRTDRIRNLDLENLLLAERPALILTNRLADEGGYFSGSYTEQAEILSEAASFGAEYIDAEFRLGKKLLSKLPKHRLIVSYHNFKNVPADLTRIYARMRTLAPTVIKIAVTARSLHDNITVFNLLDLARGQRQKIIAHCMGERGEISRILGGRFGAFLAFAAMNQSSHTAPGQVTVDLMENVYHANMIDRNTRIFGLIGNPVSQSRGIFFHNEFFRKRRVCAAYINFLVDNIASFFKEYREIIRGASVTMPFKHSIIPLLDIVDEPAARIGSVNTIVKQRGKWEGHNTDYPALLKILKERSSLKGKRVVIHGTGAMARTMAFGMLQEGAVSFITGRSQAKAKKIADEFGCTFLPPRDCVNVDADIVMNATPVGMIGLPQDRIFPPSFYKRTMIVFDVVNRPEMTPFLSTARESGCTVIAGSELFMEQAKLQSKLFLRSLS